MFDFKENRRNVPEEELIEDLVSVAKKLGIKSLTREQCDMHCKFGYSTFIRRFGKWSAALEKAGLSVKVPIYNSNEELFENLADVWTHIGKQPAYSKLTKEVSKFSVGTYENRFGSWNKALRAFIDYIENNSDTLPIEKAEEIKSRVSRTPRNINWRLRAKILIRDNCICQMCGTSPAKDSDTILHVDHVHPWSKGGETVEENLRTLCQRCNVGKSDMIVDEL